MYIPENSGKVCLTVEGGVSLVGPHCPGTVRLFCKGVGLYILRWTYNTGIDIINRVLPDDPSSTIIPTNPAFVSININITDIANDSTGTFATFSSVLTVNLLELMTQNIENITCGDLSHRDTQQINYFTPTATATYQTGVLSSIEVQLVGLTHQYISTPLHTAISMLRVQHIFLYVHD